MQKIVPEVVSGTKDRLGISYGQITPILAKATQELNTQAVKFDTTGNVGIGITSPGAKLEASGTAMIGGGSANKAVCWKSDGKALGNCWTAPAADGSCTCN